MGQARWLSICHARDDRTWPVHMAWGGNWPEHIEHATALAARPPSYDTRRACPFGASPPPSWPGARSGCALPRTTGAAPGVTARRPAPRSDATASAPRARATSWATMAEPARARLQAQLGALNETRPLRHRVAQPSEPAGMSKPIVVGYDTTSPNHAPVRSAPRWPAPSVPNRSWCACTPPPQRVTGSEPARWTRISSPMPLQRSRRSSMSWRHGIRMEYRRLEGRTSTAGWRGERRPCPA
jgi:hypothetical protein